MAPLNKKRPRRNRRISREVPKPHGVKVLPISASASGTDHKTVEIEFDGPVIVRPGGDLSYFDIDGDFATTAVQLNATRVRYQMGVTPADGTAIAWYSDDEISGPVEGIIGANGLAVAASTSVQVEYD